MLNAELDLIFTLPPPWQTSPGARLTWAAVEPMTLPEASEFKYIQIHSNTFNTFKYIQEVLLESHMKARYGNQYFLCISQIVHTLSPLLLFTALLERAGWLSGAADLTWYFDHHGIKEQT